MSLRLVHAYHESLAAFLTSKKKRKGVASFDRALWKECVAGRAAYTVEDTIKKLNQNAVSMSYCLPRPLQHTVQEWCHQADECVAMLLFHLNMPREYARSQTRYAERLFSSGPPHFTTPLPHTVLGDPQTLKSVYASRPKPPPRLSCDREPARWYLR